MKVNPFPNQSLSQIISQPAPKHFTQTEVQPSTHQIFNSDHLNTFSNQGQLLKLSPQRHKQQQIPSDMKIFLKKRRQLSQKLKGLDNFQNSNIKSNNNSSSLNHSSSHQNKPNTKYVSNHQITSIKSISKKSQPSKDRQSLNCPICQGQTVNNKTKQVWSCSHIFCQQCTKTYIEYKIKMYHQIHCPAQNCKGIFNPNSPFYCSLIPLYQRKKYLKIHRFFEINKSDELKRLCPKQDCEGVINLNKKTQQKQVSICKSCGFQVCSECFSQAHSGQCQDFETKFIKQNFNFAQCQKCKNFIQKFEGCNHISCKCGNEFCEKCKKPWTKTHICKYSGLKRAEEGWGGCDWGITTRDHLKFLLKLPMKFCLVVICVLAWTIFSFLGAPLNLVLLIYWLYLLFIKPSVEMIISQKKYWRIVLQITFLPLFMLANTGEGVQMLVKHIDGLLPEVTNSFRWIIRL